MRHFSRITIVVALIVIGIACDKPKKDEYKMIEKIEVEGTCFEDHVKQQANYKGSIHHWHNITQNVHYWYGIVFNSEEMKSIKPFEDPYKYNPPFRIEFDNLNKQDVIGEVLKIKGISHHTGSSEETIGLSYHATCSLKVTGRQDKFPPTKGTLSK